MRRVVLILAVLSLLGCVTCAKKPHPEPPDLASILKNLPDTSADENPGYDAPITPYTEPTLLLENEHGWQVALIGVPQEPGASPYICFHIKDQRALECLYIDQTDGSAEMVWVLPKKEKL